MHRNGQCTKCDQLKCPFITIVTRCFKCPKALRNNIKSLKAQTDPDYEQVFIIDKDGHGLAAADQALNKYRDANCGDYIMVLDDTNTILDKQFIEKLKAVKKATSPDIIIWKGSLDSENTDWGVRPVKNNVGSFNYCCTHKLYSKYIHVCKTGVTGNFDFISMVFHSDDNPKVEWINDVFVTRQTVC